jgi:hypothetical protein
MATIEDLLNDYDAGASRIVINSFSLAQNQGRNCFDVPHLFSVMTTNQQIKDLFI